MYVPLIDCDGITRVQVSDLITAHVQYIIGTHEYHNIIMLHHNHQNNYLLITFHRFVSKNEYSLKIVGTPYTAHITRINTHYIITPRHTIINRLLIKNIVLFI